jgi:hypothetical protein
MTIAENGLEDDPSFSPFDLSNHQLSDFQTLIDQSVNAVPDDGLMFSDNRHDFF